MFDRIILIDKPAGITSFGVVARVRRILTQQAGHKVKVGHTGTLDPFATGLLILMTGKNTKRCEEFLKLDKWYEATLRLGQVSTTGDPEGEITDLKADRPSINHIQETLTTFTGAVIQRVPAFSAVKINGRRAYDLARKGLPVDTPKRKIEIFQLDLLDYHYPELKIRTHVSSGTYIRTLGEDIGYALGTGAYLTALRRTQVGQYCVNDATTLDDFMSCDFSTPVL